MSKQPLSETGLFLPQHLLRYTTETAAGHLPGDLWELSGGRIGGSGEVPNLEQIK